MAPIMSSSSSSSSSFIAAAVLSAMSLLAIVPAGKGHVYMMNPVSRNLWGTTAFQENGASNINYCPHCFQSRGPSAVRERGGGKDWPHFNGERAPNGNYIESEEIAKRHGICGDPEQTAAEGSNMYGMENSNYPVLETLSKGDVLEVKIVVSTYHWGHVEMFICNADDLSGGPDSTVTQTCFNKYPLDRAADDTDAGPIDPAFPGRYILDPMCRAQETDQEIVPGATPGQVVTARYQLPSELTCDRCVVQMVYYTGNSCKHQGYAEFNPDSWPGSCAPNKADWINEVVGQCGDGPAYPEEFWNCADIEISADGKPSDPAPSPPGPEETEAPATPETDAPTTDGTDAPTTDGTDAPTTDGTDAPTTDGTDAPTTDGTEAPTTDGTEAPTTDGTEAPTTDGTEAPSSPESDDGSDDGGDGECADPVKEHYQCGGTEYTGSTCCEEGLQCQKMGECWSECRPPAPEPY